MKWKFSAIIFFIIMLSGCSTPATTSSNQEVETLTPTIEASETSNPLEVSALIDWSNGPHSAGYDLGKGPNTYCSRCHSPFNWDIDATIDPPPNCVSCKFANESESRMAEGNPLIPESEWIGINCEVCHRVRDDVLFPAIAWFNPSTNYYETLNTSQELCGKCHTDTDTLRYKIDLGTEIHAGYDCIECHQPHSTSASCQADGCHMEIEFVEANRNGNKHTKAHSLINCTACHDASNLEVDIDGDGGNWTTFRTVEVLGRTQTSPFTSHNLTIEVNCKRCHYPENLWNLPLIDDE